MAKTKQIDFKIVSKEEALWQNVVDARKTSIKNYEEAILVEKVFLAAAEKELEKAKKQDHK
jgi:hypothetical protein